MYGFNHRKHESIIFMKIKSNQEYLVKFCGPEEDMEKV